MAGEWTLYTACPPPGVLDDTDAIGLVVLVVALLALFIGTKPSQCGSAGIARRILGEYNSPHPRDATFTLHRPVAILDRAEVVQALD
jgi:hypothetical protein